MTEGRRLELQPISTFQLMEYVSLCSTILANKQSHNIGACCETNGPSSSGDLIGKFTMVNWIIKQKEFLARPSKQALQVHFVFALLLLGSNPVHSRCLSSI